LLDLDALSLQEEERCREERLGEKEEGQKK